jgi:NAD(P)-dependent dehydrogenase (short-subunit alcohol dehydrogenase family)
VMDGTTPVGAVIITGAARGIGAAIAENLARDGTQVMLADVAVEGAEATARSLRLQGFAAAARHVDISQPESARSLVAETLAEFGRIGALVNNAAIDAPPGLAWEITEEHWTRLIDVNLTGAWWMTQAVLGPMIAQRSGKIVFISSLAARQGSDRYSPAYAAAKAGLLGLTVGLAAQLEQFGIRVNAITPGATGNTGTPMFEDERRALLAAHPLGLVGAYPVADAVSYLLASSGDWLSGTVLNVSGGQLRGI